jgi:cellulose synthase/poly-beta-1,6-N-acetylglucosamine synthase-like glycosyltransferase
MKIAVIVPVAPFEKEELILNSVRHLKNLDWGGFEYRLLYVIDTNGENDERWRVVAEEGGEFLLRDNRRGKRAGAINDGVSNLRSFNPDYIAIFDVDSRPEKDFIVKCVRELETCEKCFIASGKRYVNNARNLVSETVEAEYRLMNFLLSRTFFKHFNGLIGVLRAEILMKERLSEDVLVEDTDFTTRMYARGMKACLADTKLYEQSPLSWSDFLSQRRRWYYGGIQLWRHRKLMSRTDFKVRLEWFLLLTLTYLPIIFLPLALILSPPLILWHYRSLEKLKLIAGFTIYLLLLQIASIISISDHLKGRDVEWRVIERSTE